MQKGFGFQQQCYADDGMWMGNQAQQQSYGFHEESWGSDNNHNHNHKQFPDMHMNPEGSFHMESELSMSKHQGGKFGGSHTMFHAKPNGYGHGHGHGYMHGAQKKFPFGATHNTSHHFSNGGINKFNGGGHHGGYFSEESEYEAYSEEHHGGAAMKMDEMRYEYRNNNYGGDGFYANQMNKNMKWKPHGGYKAEWTAKGV